MGAQTEGIFGRGVSFKTPGTCFVWQLPLDSSLELLGAWFCSSCCLKPLNLMGFERLPNALLSPRQNSFGAAVGCGWAVFWPLWSPSWPLVPARLWFEVQSSQQLCVGKHHWHHLGSRWVRCFFLLFLNTLWPPAKARFYVRPHLVPKSFRFSALWCLSFCLGWGEREPRWVGTPETCVWGRGRRYLAHGRLYSKFGGGRDSLFL